MKTPNDFDRDLTPGFQVIINIILLGLLCFLLFGCQSPAMNEQLSESTAGCIDYDFITSESNARIVKLPVFDPPPTIAETTELISELCPNG